MRPVAALVCTQYNNFESQSRNQSASAFVNSLSAFFKVVFSRFITAPARCALHASYCNECSTQQKFLFSYYYLFSSQTLGVPVDGMVALIFVCGMYMLYAKMGPAQSDTSIILGVWSVAYALQRRCMWVIRQGAHVELSWMKKNQRGVYEYMASE